MKIRNLIPAALMLAGTFIGCSKFLEVEPVGSETLSNFFQNEEQALRAVTAVYDVTGWEYSQQINEWVLGDICSDDAAKGGYGSSDHPEWDQLKAFEADGSNPVMFRQFSEMYQGIYRANMCLERIPGIDMDEDLQARLIAECYYLRAYFYFNLVKVFGGVPIVDHVLSKDEFNLSRNTIEACWTFIESDLDSAINGLPVKSGYDSEDMGRATLGAAQSLLLKVYVYQKKWSAAEAMGLTVIGSGEYALEPDYHDIFTEAHENGSESVFEIQHLVDPNDNWGDDNEGQETSVFQGGIDWEWWQYEAWGWGFVCPTKDLVDEFESEDPRLGATVIADGDVIWEGNDGDIIADNTMSETGYLNRKYQIEYGVEANESNSPANWRVIRYSDVLLMTAEAANELGDDSIARDLVNQVRTRAKNSIADPSGLDLDTVLVAVTTTSMDTLRTAIWHERRVELALEGLRFFDIVRQGRGATLLSGNGFAAGKNELFPIPSSEIALNPNLKQNPGY